MRGRAWGPEGRGRIAGFLYGNGLSLLFFLRQRGSPESEPVGASHGGTGVEG